MAELVTLTIDGQSVTVPAGMCIVDAAKKIGVDIPVFCYHPKMEPVGMCRMCLVEVGRPVIDRLSGQVQMENGAPKVQFGDKLETACTTPVSEGMQVRTKSEKVQASQKGIIEFLLTSHPLDCPTCDKGGECPLQNLTMLHGPANSRFIYDDKHHAEKHLPLGELIILDRERCIQCGRCVRFQREVVGEPVISFFQRGRDTEIVTFSNPGFDSCFSGNTTDICPVGALTTVDFRFGARPWEMKAAASICSQCSVGCNITFNTRREAGSSGQIVIKRVMPRQNEQVNEIWICDKGRFAGHHYAESQDRLTRPLIRKNGVLRSASWAAALRAAATGFKQAGDRLIVLASGRLSNESLFNLKCLADRLGGRALLYTEMGGGDSVALAGVGPGTNLQQLDSQTVILVVASDLQEEAPIWWLRVKQAAERGATLIVLNPRQTRLEKAADYVVRYAYGDEVSAVSGLMPGRKGGKIAEAFARAENAIILFGSEGLGLESSSALAAACRRLLEASGHIGRPNNGLIGVWPRVNDQGAWELGLRPAQNLPAALKGKSVYLVAVDPVGDEPALAAAIKNADFVVVQDLFGTETTKLADVVLPAQAHVECGGTFVSGERRVQRFYPVLLAQGRARPDYQITAQLARLAGVELVEHSPAHVFERIVADVKAFAGLSYAKLSEVAQQWPVVGREAVYYGGTGYANSQGLGEHLASVAPQGSGLSFLESEQTAEILRPQENVLLAVPVTRLYDRGTTMLPAKVLQQRIGTTYIVLHPGVAKNLKIKNGAVVEAAWNGLKARVAVRLDERVPMGVVLFPRSMGLPLRAPARLALKAIR